MGVYTYLWATTPVLRSSLPNGEKITLAHYKYAYKPYSSGFDPAPKIWHTMDVRSEKSFRSRKTEYFYVGDKPREGYEVRKNPAYCQWDDCNPPPGVLVGWLHQVEKKWFVSDTHIFVTKSQYIGKEFVSSEKVTYCRMVEPNVYEMMHAHPLDSKPGEWQRVDCNPRPTGIPTFNLDT